jgi:hypothetical protein
MASSNTHHKNTSFILKLRPLGRGNDTKTYGASAMTDQ